MVLVVLMADSCCYFVFVQDIATHTRITPGQREVSFRKFVDRVNKCPKVLIVVHDVTRLIIL